MALRMPPQSDRNPPSRGVDRQNVLKGRRVIVVDDSAAQRRRLSDMYETMGFKVVGEASHGLECLALAEKTKPDLISLDVIMPVMHGVEALGYLREAKTSAVVIFVSALGSIEAMTEVRAPGGYSPDAIFSKKDSVDTFFEILTSIFAGEDEAPRGQQAASKSTEEAASSNNGRAVS